MFTCILCLKEFEDNLKTREHIFPDSIGGTITLWELCKRCNDHLGKFVDSPLVNNCFISSYRLALKISGKSGKVPNPFSEGVLAENPNQKIRYRINGLIPKTHLIPSIKRQKDDESNNTIIITIDKNDEKKLPQILETIKKRIVQQQGGNVEMKIINKEEGKINQPVIRTKNFVHSYDWKRCLIKIAYELTYKIIGSKYLSDPIAEKIRFLLQKEKIKKEDFTQAQIPGKIDLVDDKKCLPLFSDPNSHYGMLLAIDNKLVCSVKIFDIFYGTIAISNQTYDKEDLYGIVIKIDVKNNETVEMPICEYMKFAGEA